MVRGGRGGRQDEEQVHAPIRKREHSLTAYKTVKLKILQEEGVQHPRAMVVQFVVWPEKPKSLRLVTKAKVE